MDAWFVHPGVLLLALAAVIPWWLARRARRQPMQVAWGAMRWLNAARRSQQRTVRLRWWIPLVRTLLLIAIAAAAAIPDWTPPTLSDPFASRATRTWWIIVIDDGPNSSYVASALNNVTTPLTAGGVSGGERRFDSALREALHLVEQASVNDAFSLVSLAGKPQPQVIGPMSEPTEIRRRLELWQPSMWRSDGLAGLEQVAQSLDDVRASGEVFDRVEIVVWSHQRSSTWSAQGTTRFAELLRKLSEAATLHWRDWGSVHTNNAAIVRIEGSSGVRFAGEKFPIWVTISHPDTRQASTRRLSWRIDERLQGETEVRLEPGAQQVVKLELESPSVGRHALSLALDDDPLPLDSMAWEVLEVVENFEIRLWSEDADEIRAFRAWATARQSEGDAMTLRVGPPSQGEPIRVNDAIWVIGSVDRPSSEALAELNRHVAAGGGVLLACGEDRSPALWLAGLGLGPGSWSVSTAQWNSVQLANPVPPPLRVFVGDAAATLASTPVWRNWIRTDPWEPIWEVGLVRDDHSNLLVAAQAGRGRVALLTTSWGAVPATQLAETDEVPEAWSAIAWWPSFPPLLARLIDDLTGADPRRNQSFSNQPTLGRWRGIESVAAIPFASSSNSTSNTVSPNPERLGESESVRISSDFFQERRQPRFVSPRTPYERPEKHDDSNEVADTDFRSSNAAYPDRPGIYEVETSTGGTRWEAWNLAHDATAISAGRSLPGWNSLDVPLVFSQSASKPPNPTDIATPLALGLIGLLLIEAFASRRGRSARMARPQNKSSADAAPPTLQTPHTPSSSRTPSPSRSMLSVLLCWLMLSASSSAQERMSLQFVAQSSTEIPESMWLPTWDSSHWQMLLVVVLVGTAMTWAFRHDWRRPRGRIALALRWVTLLSLIFAARGWVQRPVIERPARVAFLVDLSSSMNSPNDFASQTASTSQEIDPPSSPLNDRRWLESRMGTVIGPLLEQTDWPEAWGSGRDVEWYGFGERLEKFEDWRDLAQRTEQPAASQSRLAAAMFELIEQPGTRPLTAVVLVSDGVSTEAGFPIGWEDQLKRGATPWYPIRIGKGDRRAVVELATTPMPETLFVGESVISEATVTAVSWSSGALRVEWLDPQEGRTLAVRRWSPTGNGDRRTFSTPLEIDRVGPQRWQIQVVDDRDGTVLTEPRWVRFEAREHRPRVLLIGGEPTLEFRYLKHAIERARSPGVEGQAFELVAWLQTADLEYAATDASATSSFPVSDSLLASFDIIVLVDPLTVAEDPGRGLTRSDLQRIRDHVDGEGGNLVLVAGLNSEPERWRGTQLESFLPCRIEDLIRSDATAPTASPFPLETTVIGSSLAPLRPLDLEGPLNAEPSPGPAPETTSTQSTNPNEASITTLHFLANHVWSATRLRSGVRPLIAMKQTEAVDEPQIAMTLQTLGRGLVVYQGFDEAYRLRRRTSDEWAARYWVQWFHHLARHRWIDRHPVSRIDSDRDTYRVGESVRLLATRPITEETLETQVEITGPDFENRSLTLSPTGAEAGRFDGTFEVVLPGRYEVRLAGTSAVPGTSMMFDVLPRRHESDPAPPDQPLLEKIAKLSGGRVIDARSLASPDRWLPTPEVTRITAGADEPAWKRPLIPMLFGLWIIGLLACEWWLRQE